MTMLVINKKTQHRSTLLMLVLVLACSASNVHFKNLKNDLFTDYEKDLRPVIDHLNATAIGLAMSLVSITELDERNQVFVSSVIIDVSFHDKFLSWDPTNYGDVKQLLYPQEYLWLPDLVVGNSVEKMGQLGYKEMPIRILQNGKVSFRANAVLRTNCEIDVTYYPFDTQTCSIVLTTWTSSSKDIKLLNDKVDHVQLGGYQESGAWDLLSTSVTDVSEDFPENKISFNFTIRRRRGYYILNLILPVIALSMTASLVFALPADSGEKVGMSITVLLAFAVYLTIIMESMPRTSLQVSIMGVYLSGLLTATALAVVFTVFVLNIHHRDDEHPPGKIWRTFTVRLRSLIGLHELRGNRSDVTNDNGCDVTTCPDEACRESVQEIEKKEKEAARRPDSRISLFHMNKVGHGEDRGSSRGSPLDQSQIVSKVVDGDGGSCCGKETGPAPPQVLWRHVGEAVDRLLFIVFTTFTVVSSLVFVALIVF